MFEKQEDVRPVLDGIDRTGWTLSTTSGVIEGGKAIEA